ncbi:hypothetical protein [Polyangium aurulentum]|uniref:hypothetical protein n=1 Tax=Polyangium aurulentum TaxID=2567896 RepID=UPI0010AE9937|nr:hypothetical protein [Polyangium aurulentum]UQA57421.1 hypothetical protein E8A73_040070 [Polyangium aurulentum]
MHRVDPDINDNRDDQEHDGHEQFPVDIKVVRTARFHTDRGDLVRIVVMNDCTTPQYSAYREYHFGNAEVSVEDVTSFMLHSSTIPSTQEAIGEFVGTMSTPLDIPQVVSFCRGIHCPSGARKRLYKATDPDDNTKMLGVLIEQDEQGKLTQVMWYKTWEARAAFRSVPDALEFQLVTDESGTPSLDPNDIGGWTWHYSTSLEIGLSATEIKA